MDRTFLKQFPELTYFFLKFTRFVFASSTGLTLNKIIIKKVVIYSFFPLFLTAPPSYAIPRSSTSLIRNSPKEVIDQVWQIVYRDFLDSSGSYDKSQWLSLRKELLSQNYVDTIDSYETIRAMLAGLNDPYTRFLDPKQFKEMKIDTSGELTGVGIQLSIDKLSKEVVVISPIDGSPAFRAGVKPKDVIISIDSSKRCARFS